MHELKVFGVGRAGVGLCLVMAALGRFAGRLYLTKYLNIRINGRAWGCGSFIAHNTHSTHTN